MAEWSDDVFSEKMTFEEVKKDLSVKYEKKKSMPHVTRRQKSVDCDSPIRKGIEVPMSQENEERIDFNNTFKMMEFIHNQGRDLDMSTEILGPASCQPNSNIGKEMSSLKKVKNRRATTSNCAKPSLKKKNLFKAKSRMPKFNPKNELNSSRTSLLMAIAKSSLLSTPAQTTESMNSPKYLNAGKCQKKQPDIFLAPSSEMKPTTSKIRVPSRPPSGIKPSATSMRFIPCSSNKYKHVRSPIRAYIRDSVKVPLICNVYSKKPLPTSTIRKLFESAPHIETQNKQNNSPNFVNPHPLPFVVYKTAKKTKILHVPSKENRPSPSAMKHVSTSPRPPLVLKHDARVISSTEKKQFKTQDDTFADVSGAQADVSLCIQMKPRNKK